VQEQVNLALKSQLILGNCFAFKEKSRKTFPVRVIRAVGRGVQPVRLHRAPSRGGRENGWSEKNIISQGQNVPPWASEGALFKHVAQGAKMPSYGPARYVRYLL
jgi:hypothetical protein